jgi:uncharacterized membrane protein YbhN (UPF0104 family)
MQLATLKKVGKRVLQVGLPLVILAIVFYYVRSDWTKLTSYRFHVNPWLLMLAFLGFILQVLSFGLIWRTILIRLGWRLDLRTCLRVYLASEFVRYIPGNVWHVITRIVWIGKYGVPRSVAFASMTVELITKLAAGALVFGVSLLFWSDMGAVTTLLRNTPILMALGIGTIVGLLIVLHPRILNGLLNFALRILKREPVVLTLRYRDILLVTLAWSMSWLIAGCAFYVLLLALLPAAPLAMLPICIGIYAIVWDIGFLSVITPSGLGVREGAMVALFALALPVIPVALATIVAVLSRIVSTIAELMCVSIAYLTGGRQIRQVQQEQSNQSSSSTDGAQKKKGTTMPEAETPTQVGIEGGMRGD